jgi:hypothetical protein
MTGFQESYWSDEQLLRRKIFHMAAHHGLVFVSTILSTLFDEISILLINLCPGKYMHAEGYTKKQ